jgi:HD superfamily phosphodiesterase
MFAEHATSMIQERMRMQDLSPLTDYAKECLRDIPHTSKRPEIFLFRDRYTHILRVMKWCERLLRDVPAGRDVVLAAAALHDIGYAVCAVQHASHGASMAEAFLRGLGCEESFLLNVCDLIARHSDKHLPAHKMSNELIILQDADCLDEIGVTTVLWDAMDEGTKAEQSYEKACLRIAESLSRLTQRGRRLKSDAGQRLYDERFEVLRGIVREMKYELFLV